MESYAKVKPSDVKYVNLKDGITKVKSERGTIEITSINGRFYINANEKTYFLRTKYGDSELLVDKIIDLPYLADNGNNYNLKKGAYLVEL